MSSFTLAPGAQLPAFEPVEHVYTDGETAGIIVASVFLFMFAFATANSWLLFAKACINRHRNCKYFLYLAVILTLVLVGGSLAFGFGTRRKSKSAKLPLDVGSLITNLNTELVATHSHPLIDEHGMNTQA